MHGNPTLRSSFHIDSISFDRPGNLFRTRCYGEYHTVIRHVSRQLSLNRQSQNLHPQAYSPSWPRRTHRKYANGGHTTVHIPTPRWGHPWGVAPRNVKIRLSWERSEPTGAGGFDHARAPNNRLFMTPAREPMINLPLARTTKQPQLAFTGPT